MHVFDTKPRENRLISSRKTEMLLRNNNQEGVLINKVRESKMFHNLEQINGKNRISRKLADLEERKEGESFTQKASRSDFFNKIDSMTKRNSWCSQHTPFTLRKSEKMNESQKNQESFNGKNKEKTDIEIKIFGRKNEMINFGIKKKEIADDALRTSAFEKTKNLERLGLVKVEEVLERLKEGGGKRRTKDVDVKLGKAWE